LRFPLGTRIFAGTALVVTAVLGAALLVTERQAGRSADQASFRAIQATGSAIRDVLNGRSGTLRQLTAALVQVPVYVSRIGESLRSDDRANLLDQADELRAQTGADWVLITDPAGVLKAWTARRDLFDEDFSRGALIGRAMEGRTTAGLWIEPGPHGDELYQAVGLPVVSPGSTTTLGVVSAALRIDTALAGQLRRHTNSEIVFFSLDTLGVPQPAVSTLAGSALGQAIRRLTVDSAGSDSLSSPVRLAVGGVRYEGTTGLLRTADGIPIGGYLGLHSRNVDLAAYHQLSRTIRWAFLAGLLLAIAFSVLMARQISRPVGRLVKATRKVSEGQYTAELPVEGSDEIGELAAAFRVMVEELKEKDRLVGYLRTGAGPAHEAPAAGQHGLLAVGALFAGRYEIQEELGAGGMGVVYRAHDREVGETVALKAIRREVGRLDPTLVERFKQELRLARRITHRNVVRTYDLGEAGGIYYITMEFVRGTTVASLIREAGRLAVPATLTIGKQVCRALEVAHEEGIIHRDIKPQNLLVDPTGFLKVTDFGIARLTAAESSGAKGLTVEGAVMGTPQYMAPEQLLGEPVDARADLYATGGVLFECLTGRRVFESTSVMELVGLHLRTEPPDPAQLNPDVPPALAQVIVRALARKPEDRWPTASAFLHALEEV
jgi:eukaryotic-like serine/threonine-protein kinase